MLHFCFFNSFLELGLFGDLLATNGLSMISNRLPQLPTIPCTIAANGNASTAPIGPSTAPPAMAAPKATAA